MQRLFVGGPGHGRWHAVASDPLRVVVKGAVYVRDSVKWMERREWKAELFYRFEGMEIGYGAQKTGQ